MEKPPKSDYRFEKKFVVNNNNYDQFCMEFVANGFTPVYSNRRINNLYIDNITMDSFHDNTAGISNRIKNRFRWYGELFGINKIVLERKIKKDIANKKEIFKLGIHSFHTFDETNSMLNALKEQISSMSNFTLFELIEMQATLINSYSREYFISYDEKTRVTLDSNIFSYSPQTKLAHTRDDFIVEYKSSVNHPIINVPLLSNLVKSSKYCQGLIDTNLFLHE